MIKAVIYDWGGVICVNPAPQFLTACSTALGVEEARLQPLLTHYIDPFQKGEITEEALWKSICSELHIKNYDWTQPLWRPAFESFYTPQQQVIDSAKTLKSLGYKIGFLSNTEVPAMELHLSLGYDFFDARVFSCVEGIIKPLGDIYSLIAERLGLSSEECIMIDDKSENIVGAQAAGMSGILFSSESQYLSEIASLLNLTL
ncbi:MAG: HAD family phosphatase [Fibrobacterales bacterium]